ncbi:MAG TPA: phosphotransferase [Thermodesulfobacteriota bacterium]|nr:phosphotransferase [Thermodesulfobacteriota bacterium]
MEMREDIIVFAREALGLSEKSVSLELSPLEGRGSDRTFFRLRWNREDSAILVQYDPKRVENTYYADIATFLREIGVPAPRLIRHDPAGCLIVMEDLGDTDLWSLRETHWETRQVLYRKTLTIAHRLHSFPKKDFPSARVKLMEGFGPHLYLWERDYFRDHFVRDFSEIRLGPSFDRELESELSALAERLAGTARCLVHRDLQSHNVMIRDGEPFFIDFQGMRFGSLFYDLGSLLCDPYVHFSVKEQEELLSFYYGLSNWDYSWAAFRNVFWEASAQRLMQALGAFGFLGLKKGLKAFLEHIPAGLRHLQLAALQAGSLPRLRELSVEGQRVLERKGQSGFPSL